MRTISGALLAAQQSASRTPYVKMLFTSKDGLTTKDFSTDSVAFGNRVNATCTHHEEPYNEYAIIYLNDRDSAIPDLRGYWTEIGYGITGDYSSTSRLWVKHQRHTTMSGELTTVLELEGSNAELQTASSGRNIENWARTQLIDTRAKLVRLSPNKYRSSHVYSRD